MQQQQQVAKLEYPLAQQYFSSSLSISLINFNKIKCEDEDTDDIMIRENTHGSYDNVDASFSRHPSSQQILDAMFNAPQYAWQKVNTEFNHGSLKMFMAIAINRILHRCQAHATARSTLIVGAMLDEQWALLSMLSPLEATKNCTTETRIVNGKTISTRVHSIQFTAQHTAPQWPSHYWEKRYYDETECGRLMHCELNYVTLKFSQFDKRVRASFTYKTWKYMQSNEISCVSAHWALIQK